MTEEPPQTPTDEPAPTPPTTPPTAPTDETPERKGSALGALALLCSAAGVAGCVVLTALSSFVLPQAFFGLPFTALLSLCGFVMGVIAFFTSEKGSPRGGIIGATFLGALGASLQGSAVVGTLVQFLPIRAQVAPLVEEMLTLHDAGDALAIEQRLGQTAIDATEDNDLLDFFTRIETESGEIVGVRIELQTMIRSRETMNAYPVAGSADTSKLILAKPLELLHSQTTPEGVQSFTMIAVWLDEEALTRDEVLIDDLIAFLPDETMMVLRDDGPAWDFANQFASSVRVITP